MLASNVYFEMGLFLLTYLWYYLVRDDGTFTELLSPVQVGGECEKRTPAGAFLFVGMKSATRSILHTNKLGSGVGTVVISPLEIYPGDIFRMSGGRCKTHPKAQNELYYVHNMLIYSDITSRSLNRVRPLKLLILF